MEGRPLLSHVLVVDAGSTGSRIHVYRFNHCQDQPALEDEVFLQTKPGLSAYPDDPEAAARSLDTLLDAARSHIPEGMHACTPITVKATAGLRLLGEERSGRILQAVRTHLQDHYPFRVIPGQGGVEVMEGKDEGVFAWITVNYLLGHLAHLRGTAAIMDLGGGSTQIVFEPNTTLPGVAPIEPGDHRYSMEFSGHQHTLFQHSYLGYGLMEARKRVNEALARDALKAGKPTVSHPCLRQDQELEVEVEALSIDGSGSGSAISPKGGTKGLIKLRGEDSSKNGMIACSNLIRQVLFDRSKTSCPIQPCSFDGVYQPSLTHSFPDADIFAFSYVYDRLIPLGLTESFTLKDASHAIDRVCRGDKGVFVDQESLKEYQGNPQYCLDATYILELLRDGYSISENRRIQTAKKIEGFETGWCLGAAISMMDQGLYCRLEEM
ncbi:nucleoside phosphatase GDA1/CD39 [Piptocephalis cylindrospora]|uniref:guanosine-diphosphatase n=1 Tax=Piptocephalis cylindrospora TaxID=1907219 RepID=A0A4P9Y3F5_9FUNG|nr:nucleoside phosphatase GDA1/CD39 [Piptocephalis cylindrospora]|eukprot:RKP13343.1 nucleoside phosphatase GDA1/CD39 [Piptocephalis cylindrospora]